MTYTNNFVYIVIREFITISVHNVNICLMFVYNDIIHDYFYLHDNYIGIIL